MIKTIEDRKSILFDQIFVCNNSPLVYSGKKIEKFRELYYQIHLGRVYEKKVI